MRAGLLDTPITILRPTTTQNEFGEMVQTYDKLKTTRARVIHNGGTRGLENTEVFYGYRKVFEVWKHLDIKETDIIIYNDEKWRILSIDLDKQQLKKTISTELIDE